MNHRSKTDAVGDKQQKGQSIVLVALMMIGLLAFVGIAVDVGFVFARGSQLGRAVDAAVLAAVTDVTNPGQTAAADLKAGQFLNANGMPISVTQSLQSSSRTQALGAIEYSITATWPVDLFFLRVIGQDRVNVTRSATAAFFPVTDVYASRRVEDGALSTSNQAVFGPAVCSSYGDPFSPFTPQWGNAGGGGEFQGIYTYQYRILIPSSYPRDELRVELFDPDSINQPNPNPSSIQIDHTSAWINSGRPTTTTASCDTNQVNPCLLDTQEDEQLGLPLDQVNPWWFWRIDENRTGNLAGGCGTPSTYNAVNNTQTRYTLWYFQQLPDGRIQRQNISEYVGQVGDGVRDSGDHDTDMRWVSPGAPTSFDQPVFVPALYGSFQVNLADLTNNQNMIVEAGTGNRYLYLDVSTESGSSENGFEIWAGPPDYINTVPSNVNTRNVRIINEPGSHSSLGATVFALGNLPMNSNYANVIDVPLIYVPPEYAGQTIFVSMFDSDSGAQPPITFYFDTIAFSPTNTAPYFNSANTDWAITFAATSGVDPDGIQRNCRPGNCNNVWVDPAYQIVVPNRTAACNPSSPDPAVCTPFYGGRLIARYRAGGNDSFGWSVRLTGLPYLVD